MRAEARAHSLQCRAVSVHDSLQKTAQSIALLDNALASAGMYSKEDWKSAVRPVQLSPKAKTRIVGCIATMKRHMQDAVSMAF